SPFSSLFPNEIPECHPTISPRMYHTIMAPISLAVILALSFLVKRRRLHQSCWNGVPGLLSPGDLLGQDGPRVAAAAVFGILFSSLCQLVLDPDPLPLVSPASPAAREFWKILALLYYPVFYFPLLGCAGPRHRLGYATGTLLAWGHCGAQLGHRLQCPLAHKIHQLYSALSHVPILLSLALLSLWYPARLIRSLQDTPEPQIPGKSYYRTYLKAVLSKRGQKGSSTKLEESLWSRIRSYLRSYIYIPEEGGKTPWDQGMLGVGVYGSARTFPISQQGLAWSSTPAVLGAGIHKYPEKGGGFPHPRGPIPAQTPFPALFPSPNPGICSRFPAVCYISSLVLCCLLTCAMLLRTLGMHRSNLRALYQGAVLDVFSKAHILRPSRGAVVCWISFSAFQAAFACLGLLIQQVIFFLCSVAFTFLVVIPLQASTGSLLFGIIRNMWPFWLTLVVAVLVQHLLAHFQFLEQHSLQRELTNRRALYIITFLLFPINVLVGVLAGVWRVVISGLYNSVHLCRLDISLLHRGVETFDPGYHTYCHYLKVEVSQCHPLLKAFCLLLLHPGRTEPPAPPRDTLLEEG
ncbi:STRA6 protein, partial [Sterrhoptilus dennistouni]|nr:STRA6 protein [Sterrhoptilus dennistouni]